MNIENQNVWNPGYPLIKRAIYYCGRLISWQKGTVFQGDDYGKIEKVYSILICSKPGKAWKNTLNTFSLEPNYLVGNIEYGKIEYDLETIAILGLGDSERSQKDILKLLSVLMEPKMETERKKQILETDFAIPMTVEMEREASEMCTLGESIARENLEKEFKRNGKATSWVCCGKRSPWKPSPASRKRRWNRSGKSGNCMVCYKETSGATAPLVLAYTATVHSTRYGRRNRCGAGLPPACGLW